MGGQHYYSDGLGLKIKGLKHEGRNSAAPGLKKVRCHRSAVVRALSACRAPDDREKAAMVGLFVR